MSWAEVLDEESFSVGLAPQADINTVGTVWTWIDCEMPQVSYDAAQTDTRRSARSRGSATKRLTGRVWPKLAIRFPVCGQQALQGATPAYAYSTDTPALKAANLLLGGLGGSFALAYAAADITTTDANTLSLATVAKMGALVAALEASGAVNAMGFAKSIGTVGPYATNLREDLKVASGASVKRLPTLNLYPSATALTAYTVRVCGEHVDMERKYLGCVPTKASFTFDADWRLYATVELIAYGGEPVVRTTGGGGLQTVTETLALEPLVARGGARFVLGANVFTTLNDATADADGTADIRDVELTWDIPHYVARKPTGVEGVSQIIARPPLISASFSVPDISDFQVGTEHFAEAAWRAQTAVSLSCYMGDTPGQILAWSIPGGIVANFPELVVVEGVRHRRVTLQAYDYTGDAAATDGGNKVHNFALG